jgi:hypothetical protein
MILQLLVNGFDINRGIYKESVDKNRNFVFADVSNVLWEATRWTRLNSVYKELAGIFEPANCC